MSDPQWLTLARKELGFHETGDNQGIGRYIALSHCGALGDPWCAIFANAMLEQAGVRGSRSPSSQSFLNDANFVALNGPALGALVIFWRITPHSGKGHVGFYVGEGHRDGIGRLLYVLGGNEQDQVMIEPLPAAGSHMAIEKFMWPKSVLLPAAIGPVAYAGSQQVGTKVT